MDNAFIERRRREYVKAEAQKLFEKIIEHVIAQSPNTSYAFSVQYDIHARVIDDMIFQRTKDLFQEMNSTLSITRLSASDSSVQGHVTVPLTEQLETKQLKKMYWSRAPGKFVNKYTGKEISLASDLSTGPAFNGTVREWYETLVETLIDAGNAIHKKALDAPETIYVSPDVNCILECSVLYRPTYNTDFPHVGTLANRYKIYRDESLKNSIFVSLVKNQTKFEVEVEVLDINII